MRHPSDLSLLGIFIQRLARLKFESYPKHLRHAEDRRQEIGANLRVLHTHSDTVQQQPASACHLA